MTKQWRVSQRLPALKGAAALVFGVIAVLFAGDTVRLVVAGVAMALLGVSALRDLVVPVRLAADDTGVTVAVGLFGSQFVAWPLVEALRLDQRRRLGLRNELLEIDTGADLYLFTENELGAKPADVLRELRDLRQGVS